MKSIFRNIALGSLMLASVVGLAPAAFSQSFAIRFEPASIIVNPTETTDVRVRVSGTGSAHGVSCERFGGTLSGGGTQRGSGSFTYTYTAPQNTDNGDVFECTATISSHQSGSFRTLRAKLIIFLVEDETPPVLTFTPATLTVNSGGTGTSALTATDNVGVTATRVTCTLGSYDRDTGTYTAPVLSFDGNVLCTATAFDAAGNRGIGTLTVSVAREATPPVLTFSPNSLALIAATVVPGTTVPVTLTATDNVGIARGPTVTCTRGSFDVGDNTYTLPDVSTDTTGATCRATASDAAGNEGTATLTVSFPGDTTPPVIKFDRQARFVFQGTTVPVTVTARDNVDGDISGKVAVTCTHGSFADGKYTAPVGNINAIDAECTATATDAAGNTGTATAKMIIPRDGVPPVVTWTPATLTVDSGGTATATVTATDNVRLAGLPGVTCRLGGFSTATNTYTAPHVVVDTTTRCTGFVQDAAGNQGAARLTISIIAPPDETPPTLTFTPATLAVVSGGTGSSTLTARDNVAVTTGPDVTCTQGSFANNTYTAPVVSEDTTGVTCTATASDAAGNEGTATLMVSIAPDTTPPVLTFAPATLTVKSGETAMSTLTA
ncbi:MAG: hypothetical protein GDA39_10365, partial [Hyphomonadaceae bacterium]|nr:hypothetical protein [Hyphomonadaceae bacterium]